MTEPSGWPSTWRRWCLARAARPSNTSRAAGCGSTGVVDRGAALSRGRPEGRTGPGAEHGGAGARDLAAAQARRNCTTKTRNPAGARQPGQRRPLRHPQREAPFRATRRPLCRCRRRPAGWRCTARTGASCANSPKTRCTSSRNWWPRLRARSRRAAWPCCAMAWSWQGRPLPPAKVSWQNEQRLRFALKGIAPAAVPWMCEQVACASPRLKRIRLGRAADGAAWRRGNGATC